MYESEARAIVKEWLNSERSHFQNIVFSPKSRSEASNGARVKYIHQGVSSLNNNLIHFDYSKHPVTGRESGEKYEIIWHGEPEKHVINGFDKVVYPVFGQAIDLYHDWVLPRTLLLYLSEHSMAQIKIRSDAESLRELNSVLSHYCLCFLDILLEKGALELQDEDFIVLTSDGYMPFASEDFGCLRAPISKTWVSREKWYPKNVERLSEAADRLKDNSSNTYATLCFASEIGLAAELISGQVNLIE